MSKTPETDAKIIQMLSPLQSGTIDVVPAYVSRQIEENRDILRKQLLEMASATKNKNPSDNV